VEVQLLAFLTSAQYEGELSVSCPGRFIPGVRFPATDWVGPGGGLGNSVSKHCIHEPAVLLRFAEGLSWVVPASYSRAPEFSSWHRGRLSWGSLWFLQFSMQVLCVIRP